MSARVIEFPNQRCSFEPFYVDPETGQHDNISPGWFYWWNQRPVGPFESEAAASESHYILYEKGNY
jgi:hypothetical protein